MTIQANAIGAQFLEVSAAPKFKLGTHMKGDNGAEWMYIRANGAIASAGQVVVIDVNRDASLITNTNGLRGMAVGVVGVAAADNDYLWVQIKGLCVVQVAASCAANVEITTTTTAGELDDAAGTGTKEILGITLTTARGGTAGTAAGVLNYPMVYVTN